MSKKSLLCLSALLLGATLLQAGWVYYPDEVETVQEEEIDLTESVGQIEQDAEDVSATDDALLPWGIDESHHEAFSSFIEEGAKQASHDYEESFALDLQTESLEVEEQLPSMERVPSRGVGLVSKPKISNAEVVLQNVPTAPKAAPAERVRPKAQLSHIEQLAPSEKLEKRPVTKKSPQTKTSGATKKSRSSLNNKARSETLAKAARRIPSTRSQDLIQKKKRLQQLRKDSLVNREKRQRPVERLAESAAE